MHVQNLRKRPPQLNQWSSQRTKWHRLLSKDGIPNSEGILIVLVCLSKPTMSAINDFLTGISIWLTVKRVFLLIRPVELISPANSSRGDIVKETRRGVTRLGR